MRPAETSSPTPIRRASSSGELVGVSRLKRLSSVAVAVVLLVSASSSWAQGTSTPSALTDAIRALDGALANHDREAFARLIAPDAVFTLPAPTRGADAIVNAWLPFLIIGGNTMTLTSSSPNTAASEDLAYIAGAFTIIGRSTGAPVTDARGEYIAVWRLIEGRWQLTALSGTGSATVPAAGGLGGYRFGMTLDQVRQVGDCHPYSNVSQTGGIECPNYTFEGGTINISFLFNNNRLRRIQLWLYEGGSEADAKKAVAFAIEFLRRTAGGVSIGGLPRADVTDDLVMGMLKSGGGSVTHFDLSTPAGPQPEAWFGRVARHPAGYFVFLLVDARQGR